MLFVLIGLYVLSIAALIAMALTRRVANARSLSTVKVMLTWDDRPRTESYPIEVRDLRWLLTIVTIAVVNAGLVVLSVVPVYALAGFLSGALSVLTVAIYACMYVEYSKAEAERVQRRACYIHPIDPDVARSRR